MKKLTWLSPLALVPAGVGLWLEHREAIRTLAAVGDLGSAWQRARIAGFGFDDAARYATLGLGASGALFFGLVLAVLARRLRAAPEARRSRDPVLMLAFLASAAALAAAAEHSAALGRIFGAVSQEKLGPLQTADVLVAALDTAAAARALSALLVVALAGIAALASWQRWRAAARPAYSSWGAIALSSMGVAALYGWQARAIDARRATLETLANSYYPSDVRLVAAPRAHFARRGNDPVLWVGAQHIYFAELGQKPHEIAPATLLLLPSCVERLQPALSQLPSRFWEDPHRAIALDADTSRAGLRCLIHALQRPIVRRSLPEPGEPEQFEPLELDWLVRADPRLLEPPFDVVGVEFGAARFEVRRHERPGQTVIALGAAQDMLRSAAGQRDAVLVLDSPASSNLGLDEELPTSAPAPSPPAPTISDKSPVASAGAPTTILDLRLGPPHVTGPLDEKLLRARVAKLKPRFEACYGERAVGNPYLEGRISARFIVGRDGAIANVSNAGSDLPDSKAIACVLDVFYALEFPPSPSGVTTVIFPLRFEPRGK